MQKYRHWHFFSYFAYRLFYTKFNFNPFNVTVMKNKNDVYTKIVLTVIAVFLGIIIVRDTDVVSKAHANELDLSGLKIENASNAEATTFYVFENSRLNEPVKDSSGGYISSSNTPIYVITTKRSGSL